MSSSALQGVTRIVADGAAGGSHGDHRQQQLQHRTKLALGYQLIQMERDLSQNSTPIYSGIGHAGVGGSIGFWHRPTGVCVGLMLNKADASHDVTIQIIRVIGNHFGM